MKGALRRQEDAVTFVQTTVPDRKGTGLVTGRGLWLGGASCRYRMVSEADPLTPPSVTSRMTAAPCWLRLRMQALAKFRSIFPGDRVHLLVRELPGRNSGWSTGLPEEPFETRRRDNPQQEQFMIWIQEAVPGVSRDEDRCTLVEGVIDVIENEVYRCRLRRRMPRPCGSADESGTPVPAMTCCVPKATLFEPVEGAILMKTSP